MIDLAERGELGSAHPPDWRWMMVGMETVIGKALRGEDVAPEEVAVVYRERVLVGHWRIEHYGIDAFASIRAKWLSCLGRLIA
jgi:hypothetical protein